jgi:UDP-2-acetamido-3-amino-2,3-dideoxy-glucuronate N-acetyltransferase
VPSHIAHPSADVEPGAHVGPGTRIWHRAHVRSGACIGSDCTIGKDVFIDAGVVIGDRVKIQNGVSVYRGVRLEDEVFVGPHAVFTNDRYPRAVSPDWVVVPTHVCRGASIGAHATVICGVTIRPWAMIAAAAVVTRDVPAQALVMGNPARIRGYVCRCGQPLSKGSERPAALLCPRCATPGASGGGTA